MDESGENYSFNKDLEKVQCWKCQGACDPRDDLLLSSNVQVIRSRSPKEWVRSTSRSICNIKVVRKKLPFLSWLPQYDWRNDLLTDIIAGFSVGLTVVPQGIAYAAVAGLEPQYGLYTAFIGCFVYVIFGSTRSITIGPTALLAISTYPNVKKWGPEMAVFLCFMSGVIETVLGLFNLGFIIDFFSAPVIVGFSAAAAVTIASTQVKSLFGLKFQSDGFTDTWGNMFSHISETRVGDAVMGFVSIAFLLGLRELGRIQFKNPSKRTRIFAKILWVISTARNAICVCVCSGIAYAMYDQVNKTSPFQLTGKVAGGIPAFETPPFSISNGTTGNVTLDFMGMCREAGTSLVVIPLIAILETVAIAKSFARGKRIDSSQEMIAIGLANILGAFVKSFPTTGSFSRTAVNEASGAKSPLGGIITGSIVLLAVGLLSPHFYFIPKCSLAAVIISAVVLMIEYHVIKPIWRTKKSDLIPLIVTFLCGLFLGLEYGILIGAAIHIMLMSYGTAEPKIIIETVKGRHEDMEFLVIRPEESLLFPSVDFFSAKVRKSIRTLPHTTPIVFDLSKVTRIDYASAMTLKTLSNELTSVGFRTMSLRVPQDISHILDGVKARNLRVYGSLLSIEESMSEEMLRRDSTSTL